MNTSEILKEREERKQMFISLVLSKNHGGADEAILVEEASKMFDKANPIKK